MVNPLFYASQKFFGNVPSPTPAASKPKPPPPQKVDLELWEQLFLACESGDGAAADLILGRAAPDPSSLARHSTPDRDEWTALDAAAYGGHLAAVRAVARVRPDEHRLERLICFPSFASPQFGEF